MTTGALRRTAPRWILWLACVAAALFQVSRTPVLTDITAFLPGPSTPTQRVLAEQLRDGVASRVVLVALELPAASGAATDPATRTAEAGAAEAAAADASLERALAAAATRLAAALRDDPDFAWVGDGSPRSFERDLAALSAARYLLDPGADAAAFTPEGLSAAFERLRVELRGAAGPLVRSIAAEDPTLATLGVLAALGGDATPASRHGAWFTPDGRAALLVAETVAPGFDVDAQQRAIDRLRAHAERALAAWPDAHARPRLHLTGPGVFGAIARDAIERDATRLSALALALIAVLLALALRSVRVLGLAALPVATGALVGFACVGAVWGTLHGVTLGFGATLIGEAVDYAIYAWVQRRDDGSASPGVWRGIALAIATSCAGYAAMLLSGFAGLAQLGVFSIAGIVAAGLCARWLLPDLMPARAAPLPEALGRRLSAWSGGGRASRAAIVIAAAAAAAYLALRPASTWNDDLAAITPLPAAVTERDGRLRAALGLPEVRFVIATRGASREEALALAERIEPGLRALVDAHAIAGYRSPATVLPSVATQRRRQAALPAAPVLRETLARALAGGNLRAEAFEPFVEAVDRARTAPPITAAHYDGTGIGRRIAAQLVDAPDSGAIVAITVAGVADPDRFAAVAAARLAGLAGERAAQVAVLDLKADVEHLVAEYRTRALHVALAGWAAIVALLALRVRERRAVATIATVLACTVALTAAAMTLLYNHLTLFHLLALLLVVGVVSNYAMFCTPLPQAAADRAAILLSVLLCGASTFLAFVVLARSSAPVLAMIGSTVAVGVAVGVLASGVFAATATGRPDPGLAAARQAPTGSPGSRTRSA